jgi:hypothetical protein
MGLDKVCYGGCVVQSGVVLTPRVNREAASLGLGGPRTKRSTRSSGNAGGYAMS